VKIFNSKIYKSKFRQLRSGGHLHEVDTVKFPFTVNVACQEIVLSIGGNHMKKLDERHFKVMEMLMKKRTQKEIAEEIGVSRMTIHRWMKDPLFEREFKYVLRNHCKNHMKDVMDAMVSAAVEDRNAAAAKLIFQINNLMDADEPNVQVNNQIDLATIREELKNL
jgi:Trp operon repressor